MKQKYHIIIGFLLLLFAASCTEVVDLDVDEAAPRLVIDASINWVKGSDGSHQEIQLSQSTYYFASEKFVPVSGAAVKVINTANQEEYVFQDEGNGTYVTDHFVPVLNQEFALEVVYQEEIYRATEVFTPVPPISKIEQEIESGMGEDEIVVKVYFEDPAGEDNYYYAAFESTSRPIVELGVQDDKFRDGNSIYIEYDGEPEAGDVVDINLYGISDQYYTYLDLLVGQSQGEGGPFPSPPAEVRGNCVNASNAENYAFGYFRLSEADHSVYTIE